MPEFIFMLTRDDKTLPDAQEVFATVAAVGVTHVGCKDIGLPEGELAAFLDSARAAGATTHLEVVSATPEDELRSAEAAMRVRPDYLIGGTQVQDVQRIIEGSGMRYFPYIGRIVGHPCLLRGTIERSARTPAASRRRAWTDQPAGYRYDGDVAELVRRVSERPACPDLRRLGRLGGAHRGAVGAGRVGLHGRNGRPQRRVRAGRRPGRPADGDPGRRAGRGPRRMTRAAGPGGRFHDTISRV